MKYQCEMIEDLLPLYKDDVCSPSSKQAVEEHLAECPKCSEMLKNLTDTVIDEVMVREKDEVIESQSKFFKRKSAVVGSIIAGIFALPILICLIVNLASGQGLSWFFIVLAAMLIPTSLFVVPLMAPQNKMFLTMLSFTASVLVLLGVCCAYSHGSWFLAAGPAVLFGLTFCFGPFIACRRPVREHLGNNKGLTVMAADTILFYIMTICIGLYVNTPGYFRMMFCISIPVILLAWIFFLIIRYLPANGFIKAGACIAVLSFASYFGTLAIESIITATSEATEVVSYTEPDIMTMLIGLAIAAVFAGIGLLKSKKGGQSNE